MRLTKIQPTRHSHSEFRMLRARFRSEELFRSLCAEEVAEVLEIRPKTVREWAKADGFPLEKSRRERLAASKRAALLASDYIVDGRATVSISQLGRSYGVCCDTAWKWMKEAGIERVEEAEIKYSIFAQIPLPAESILIAKHLKSWRRPKSMNDIVWPIIAKRRWHESTHN